MNTQIKMRANENTRGWQTLQYTCAFGLKSSQEEHMVIDW